MRKYENKGRDQINIETFKQFILLILQFFIVPADNSDSSAFLTLRNNVNSEVKKRFEQQLDRYANKSLDRSADSDLINVRMQMEPSQVCNPWSRELLEIAQPPLLLDTDKSIVDVFENPEVNRSLLILGEPGSGKTMKLLELAKYLLQCSEQDPAAPIPILVNLSSWKDSQKPMFDWLLEELWSKYGIPENYGQKWLEEKLILPLLDGLDEVEPKYQEFCAKKLNEWLNGDITQQPVGVVLCCRRQAYIDCRQRLYLGNCVGLLLLEEDQIVRYLMQFGLDKVWESAQNSLSLKSLIQKPLFLAVFGSVVTAERFNLEEWQRCILERAQVKYLFDRYCEAVMEMPLVDRQKQDQEIKSKTYEKKALPDRKKVQRALVFAAKALEKESQTELLIAKIQPKWLRNKRKQRLYRSIVGLTVGLIAGLMVALSGGLSFGLSFGLSVGLMIGMIGLMVGLSGRLDTIEPVGAIKIPTSCQDLRENLSSLRKCLKVGLMVGPILGLIQGLVSWLIGGLKAGLILALILWLILGLGWLIIGFWGGLLFWLIRGRTADIEDRIVPNQGIKNSRNHMLNLTVMALLGGIFIKLLASSLSLRGTHVNLALFVSLSVFILYGFCRGGGLPLCQHIALRIVLALNGFAPYRYDKLLNYCTERLLLQRICGSYRFMHKLLQEHFAKMPLD
jgi:NACHT domain